MTDQSIHVAILGGGISGLSTAWFLQQQAQALAVDLHYSVIEKSERWGGKILTETVNLPEIGDFVVEAGPDSFITQKPWAYQLAQSLGLDDALLGTNDAQRHVYVLNRGKPVILPDGVLLIVPTKFMPFALSRLISPLGKLRMGMDWFIPAKEGDEDETLADFVRRRLGHEALDKIAEPLMSGIYNAEAERQSVRATFPRFRQVEQKHGSLIRGMLASRKKARAVPQDDAKKPRSVFMSLQEGTQTLIDELQTKLTGDLRRGAGVACIEPLQGRYRIRLENGEELVADTVVMTTPAYISAQLIRPFAREAAAELENIRYVSTGTISLAYRAEDIKKPLKGFGIVMPRSEQRPINALTISSTKFNHRAPAGTVLLRVFFGGSRSPQTMQQDNETLLQTVRDELADLLGIRTAPLFHRIYRWPKANPQYDVGHLGRVDTIEAGLPPGMYVTGSAYRGVGLPDCVNQAQQTAATIVQDLPSIEPAQPIISKFASV